MSLNGTQKADFYEGTVALEIMAEMASRHSYNSISVITFAQAWDYFL